jgi:hypothetical protein
MIATSRATEHDDPPLSKTFPKFLDEIGRQSEIQLTPFAARHRHICGSPEIVLGKKQLVRAAQQMRCDSLDAAMRWQKVRNLFAANETRLLAERLRIVISMVSHVMSLACIAFERFVSRK